MRPGIGLALMLLAPLPAGAEGVRDTPRAVDVFAGLSGYADLPPDRYGTPADPAPGELGLLLVSRILRNVCLGIEAGQGIAAVTPEGFAPHSAAFWLMGDATPKQGGPVVLSSTGEIALDEDDGHPAIELRPAPSGMTCRVNWRIPGELDDATKLRLGEIVTDWLPWEYALVAAGRPERMRDPAIPILVEWDRPCGDRWCAMTALYHPRTGDVTLTTTLDITDVEGNRP